MMVISFSESVRPYVGLLTWEFLNQFETPLFSTLTTLSLFWSIQRSRYLQLFTHLI